MPEAGSTGVKREPGSEGGLAAESAENDDEAGMAMTRRRRRRRV